MKFSQHSLYLQVILFSLALNAILFFGRSTSMSLVGDDVMNTWVHSLPNSRSFEFSNLLTFASPLDRSTATLYYRSLYETYGFHPLPLRAALALLQFCNLLVWFYVFRLYAKVPTGAFLCLIAVAYFPQFQVVYLGPHMIYDTLASLFMWSAFLCLRNSRAALLIPGLILYQLALGAKEVSVCLPLILFAAWLLDRRSPRSFLLLIPQTAWYLSRKVLMTANAGYTLDFNADRLASNFKLYTALLLDMSIESPTLWLAAAIASIPFAIALLTRDRRPVFGFAIILAFCAILLFAAPRNLYVFFAAIPALGLIAMPMLDTLASRGPRLWLPIAISYCSLILVWDLTGGQKYRASYAEFSAPIRAILASPGYRNLTVRKGGLVLIESGSVDIDDGNLQRFLGLRTHDVGLRIIRQRANPIPPGADIDATIQLP